MPARCFLDACVCYVHAKRERDSQPKFKLSALLTNKYFHQIVVVIPDLWFVVKFKRMEERDMEMGLDYSILSQADHHTTPHTHTNINLLCALLVQRPKTEGGEKNEEITCQFTQAKTNIC